MCARAANHTTVGKLTRRSGIHNSKHVHVTLKNDISGERVTLPTVKKALAFLSVSTSEWYKIYRQ